MQTVSVPVLVIHGVANRDPNAFRAEVENLQSRVGRGLRLIPVWWADLGATTDNLPETLPDMDGSVRTDLPSQVDEAAFRDLLASAVTTGSRPQVRSANEQAEIVIAAAEGDLSSATSIRSEVSSELAEAIREAWPQTKFLRLVRDETALQAIGRTIGAAVDPSSIPDESDGPVVVRDSGFAGIWGEAVETRSVRTQVHKLSEFVISQVDKAVGAVVGQVLGDVNQALRAAWSEPIGCFLGDILAYQRKQREIHERLFAVIADQAPGYGNEKNPISVIAHSLGGVLAFDATIRGTDPLWIDGFVTFGSQASFFEVLDPRDTLPRYMIDNPITLPKTVARWTNLWEPLDVLAFAAGRVFRLHSGLKPTDLRIPHDVSYGLATHGSYWRSTELVAAVHQTIGS